MSGAFSSSSVKNNVSAELQLLKRSTMRDVAAMADVSAKTVSRVINREKYISPEVAARVHDAMRRLNYRHNLAASQLRAGTNSAAVGVILVDISNPFSSAVHRAIEDTCRASNIAVLSASTDEDAERERAAVHAFSTRRVGGLIIMPASRDQSYLQTEISAGIHVVIIDRPPAFLAVDSVTSDNRLGADAGVQHLIAHGHRRVGFIGDWPQVASSQQRLEGYKDALGRAGLEVSPSIVSQGFDSSEAAEAATKAMLASAQPPTALFVAQNALCAPVMRAVRAFGARDRVAIVGFDGFEGADLAEPGLTVVCQDPGKIGQAAARILMNRMQGANGPVTTERHATELIARGTGEIRGPYAPAATVP